MHGERRFCCCCWCWCLKDIFHRGLAADFGCVWRLCCKAQVLNMAYSEAGARGAPSIPHRGPRTRGRKRRPKLLPSVQALCLQTRMGSNGCTGQFEERQLGLTWTAKSHWSVSVSYGVKLLSISKCFVAFTRMGQAAGVCPGRPADMAPHRNHKNENEAILYSTVQYVLINQWNIVASAAWSTIVCRAVLCPRASETTQVACQRGVGEPRALVSLTMAILVQNGLGAHWPPS